MACRLRELAERSGVPLGIVLEGGYNRRVLAECVCEILPALAGEVQAPPPAPHHPAESQPMLAAALERIGRHWPLG